MPEHLRSIAVEYGVDDENSWIPRGCQYFSQLLTKQGIPNQLIAFQGGHQDSLGMRMSRSMLPFFSEHLLIQKPKSMQSQSSSTNAKSKSTHTKRKKK